MKLVFFADYGNEEPLLLTQRIRVDCGLGEKSFSRNCDFKIPHRALKKVSANFREQLHLDVVLDVPNSFINHATNSSPILTF